MPVARTFKVLSSAIGAFKQTYNFCPIFEAKMKRLETRLRAPWRVVGHAGQAGRRKNAINYSY